MRHRRRQNSRGLQRSRRLAQAPSRCRYCCFLLAEAPKVLVADPLTFGAHRRVHGAGDAQRLRQGDSAAGYRMYCPCFSFTRLTADSWGRFQERGMTLMPNSTSRAIVTGALRTPCPA
jgi:hypothetical protein